MDGSSLQKVFFWKKKKKSPLNKALKQLKRALPKKKTKRKSLVQQLSLDNLKKDKQKKNDKKKTQKLKGLSLINLKKESVQNTPEEKKEKDRDGLGRVGDKIKKKLSLENKKEISAQTEVGPPAVNLKENQGKTSLKKLKMIMRASRPTETKTNK